jgi:uncharacterized protein (UPF0332 family)
MKPRDFLDVADELSDGEGEAHWRSAVSRAYYAAFHVARRLLIELGFVPPRSEQVHAYLCRRLNNSNHAEVTRSARRLERLRDLRNAADYDVDLPFDDDSLSEAISKALDVIGLLEEVVGNDSVRDRVTQAMRDYERDVLKEVTWRGPAK